MMEAALYTTFSGDPYFNMAFDEWMFARVAQNPGLVAFRLYTWSEGAITFGCNQKEQKALDFSKAGETAVIRRITGGRAIYHDRSELTYAVVANTDSIQESILAGTLSQSSKAIANALVQFLACVGTQSVVSNLGTERNLPTDFLRSAPCFDSTSRHEVVAADRKVVASAQRRIGTSFLQHGSIKTDGVSPHPALRSVATSRLKKPGTLGSDRFRTLSLFFQIEMGSALGIKIIPTELDDKEAEQVQKLTIVVREKCLMRRDIL